MAEQLNKLGRVLVYDSDVNLIDRTPGGKGFQSVTLDNTGAFIDGTLSGTDVHVVKANGSYAENGEALKEAYETAKNNVSQIITIEDADTNVVSYQWIFGKAGDLTVPFELASEGDYQTDNVFFRLDNFTLLSTNDQITFIGSGGEKAVVSITSFGGGAFLTNTLISGTPFALENVVRIDIAYSSNVVQTLIVAPGTYNVGAGGLLLDGAVNVISGDGESSVIISGGDVTYSGYTQSISNYAPVILGIDVKTNFNSFIITPSSKKAVFKKCKAYDNSFMDGSGAHAYHKFIECEANEYGFGSNEADMDFCEFYNCKIFRYGFMTYNSWGEDNKFYDCKAYGNSFLYELNKTNTNATKNIIVENCEITNSRGFVANCGNSTSETARLYNVIIKNCSSYLGSAFGEDTYFNSTGFLSFLNCSNTNGSAFGQGSYCTKGNIHYNIIFNGCIGSGFGSGGFDLDALFINCIGQGDSQEFQAAINITAKFVNCIGGYATGNTYSVKPGSTNGAMLNCYTRDGQLFVL